MSTYPKNNLTLLFDYDKKTYEDLLKISQFFILNNPNIAID